MILEQFFLPKSERLNEKQRQAASLLIKFILISTFFAIGHWLFSFVTGFLLPRYLMAIVGFLFIGQLFSLRCCLSFRVISHLFIITCWLVVLILSMGSGGIKSFVVPWISLIPVMALVFLSKRAAWRWVFIGLLTVIAFVLFKTEKILPTYLLLPSNDLWIASLHIGLLSIILILTYIFYEQKNDLFETVEKQNEKLAQAQKVMEQQHLLLQIKNVDLEAEIEKRTHELVRYNQQLEQFTFIASHNLRSPIARILGLASLLETPLDLKDETEIRQRLLQSTHDLDQVVKDLNLILNIRKDSDLVHKEMILVDELQAVLSILELDIISTKANVHIDVAADLKIHSVRPYLHSIITNLLSNSLKYNKLDSAPEVLITANRDDQHVVITIQDKGIGMDNNLVKEKIFTLYSRFHTHVEGRGLGLYLVKTQLDSLGGTIHMDSKINQGTQFTLTFKQPIAGQ